MRRDVLIFQRIFSQNVSYFFIESQVEKRCEKYEKSSEIWQTSFTYVLKCVDSYKIIRQKGADMSNRDQINRKKLQNIELKVLKCTENFKQER